MHNPDEPIDPRQRQARSQAAATARTGIDEAMIDQLVRTFYGRVQLDPILGPIFTARIVDWEPHLDRISAFWSSVILMTGRYHGRPMAMHATLPIEAAHFDRWLALFATTAREVCPPVAAAGSRACTRARARRRRPRGS